MSLIDWKSVIRAVLLGAALLVINAGVFAPVARADDEQCQQCAQEQCAADDRACIDSHNARCSRLQC